MDDNIVYKNNTVFEGEGLSPRALMRKAREYRKEFIKFWWLFLLMAAVLSGLLFLSNSKKETVFPADLTFMVNSGGGGGQDLGLSSILNQFGIGSSGSSSLEKVVALAESRFIGQKLLFTKVVCEGREDYIANHIINAYDLVSERNIVTDSPEQFFKNDSIEHFSLEEKRVFLMLYRFLSSENDFGSPIVSVTFTGATSIFTFQAATKNEELSIAITEGLYSKLEEYYVEQATGQQQFSADQLQYKVDSLQNALASVEYQLARAQDRSAGIFQKTGRLRESQLQREAQILSVAYAESVRRLETTKFLLYNATPVFIPLDFPLSPLLPQRPDSLIRTIVIGSLLGTVIAAIFVFGRKLFIDAINSDEA